MNMTPGSNAILVLTHFPSPYQVELFDCVAQSSDLVVAYLHRQDRGRAWKEASLQHRALFLEDEDDTQACRDLVHTAPLVVFNYYQDRRAVRLVRLRSATGKPWVYWGERPGFHQAQLGRFARRLALQPLHVSHQPIWGIGQWAVDAYEMEFGSDRPYVNLPYFSNLQRYQQPATTHSDSNFVFMYSGSLSRRKGVDVLAKAFDRLAAEYAHVRLRMIGSGELASAVTATLAPFGDRVEMLGFKDWPQAPLAYAGAHVLCVPSRHDGWGLVVPEGLAAGLPVITTNRTGAALDLVTPGGNGWLIPAGNADALYSSMKDAATLSGPAWSAMRDRARASIARHTLADGARRFLDAATAAMHPRPVATR